MVVEMTKGKKRPMIFLTAPPEIEQTACLRFRVPRNLPYRDAPPYKSSIYYWWWTFLKRDQNYADTCASRGRGQSAKLYKDFGNVFKSDFLTWWRCHQGLFAEQSAAEDHKFSVTQKVGFGIKLTLSGHLIRYMKRYERFTYKHTPSCLKSAPHPVRQRSIQFMQMYQHILCTAYWLFGIYAQLTLRHPPMSWEYWLDTKPTSYRHPSLEKLVHGGH